MDTNINFKSPKSIALGIGAFLVILAASVFAVKLGASGIDKAMPGKGYGAYLKSLFGIA